MKPEYTNPCITRLATDDRPINFENFKWPYLRNGSSDPLHVWF